jgi:L-alanine-DL-glutamate epimerase-like enolase superfamily enzyme
MLEEGNEALGRGFKSFKIKIGLDPAKDVKAIAALRKQLGDDIMLYVDANQAYSYADAVWALPRMEPYGIVIVEDPMQNWDVDGRRKLAERLNVPLLGDECVTTPIDVKREIDLGILRMINLKPPRSGYYASRKIVHLAEQAGLACMMGTMLETDIGVLAAAHFAAAFKVFTYPAELTYCFKMQDRLLTTPLRVEDGVLCLPDGPGIGAEIDEDKLAKYRVTL